MTMPFDVETQVQTPQPIPVVIANPHEIKPDLVAAVAPEFGAWQTWVITGSEPAFQILAQSPKRKRALILIQPGTAANVAGFVRIGTQEQMQGAIAAGGGQLVNGNMVQLESQSAVWLVGDGSHSFTVVVLDERFRK